MNRILLVEPDYKLAHIYKTALDNTGSETVIANSAQAGVMAADKLRPDLVILEIQLVEHSGIEFLYEFRSYSEWQDVPVIMHTQVPADEFRGSWQLLKEELGVEDYLYKPRTKLVDLLDKVESLTS